MKEVIEILIVDDSLSDAELTRETLLRGGLKRSIHLVTDGEKALQYLHQKEGYENIPRPECILLDLDLPNLSGLEVLSKIKTHAHLAAIPVVILSGSDNQKDIQKSYDLGASAVLTKPLNIDDFSLFVTSNL